MFELTIKGNTPEELYSFMQELLHKQSPITIPGKVSNPTQGATAPATAITAPPPTQSAPVVTQNPITYTAPNTQSVPIATTAPQPIAQTPTTPAPAVTGAVQTAAPTYTLEQLAQAGAMLAQTNKLPDCLALMKRYGIETIVQLQPEQYGPFATELRGLGAQL